MKYFGEEMHKIRYFALSLLLTIPLVAEQSSFIDATEIPFEKLLNTEYIPANSIANQVSNASSAVSIVTAEDIKDYGYRTLGEILASMRGLHVTQDYTYTFVGGRGFPTNEYAGRIIVLIDGYRADDSLFGQAYLGNDGILDVAIIERVEYIPGGGSAGYGDGALLGAINIITKKGSDIDGTQVVFGFGNHDAHQQRITFGDALDNGANILLYASTFHAKGVVDEAGNNDESNKRFLAKYDTENFSFLGAWAKREINQPTYSSGDSLVYGDENAFSLLKYHTDLGSDLKFSFSAWYGRYVYSSDYFAPLVYSYDSEDVAQWYGSDIKLIGTWFDNHTLSLGMSYRNDYDWHTDATDFDIPLNQLTQFHDRLEARKTYSLYLYDDFTFFPSVNFNYGFRYEKSNNDVERMFSPRAAIIYTPLKETTLKISAGITHRQATASEQMLSKEPEDAKTVEMVLEHYFENDTKLTASLYQYRINNRISYFYLEDVITNGAEIEFEKHWIDGTRFRTSYVWQDAKEANGKALIQSPKHLGKFNLSVPLFIHKVRAAFEAQYVGKYLSFAADSDYRDAHTLVNVNLLAEDIIEGFEFNMVVHDLFKKSDEEEMTLLPQSGRILWMQVGYRF